MRALTPIERQVLMMSGSGTPATEETWEAVESCALVGRLRIVPRWPGVKGRRTEITDLGRLALRLAVVLETGTVKP